MAWYLRKPRRVQAWKWVGFPSNGPDWLRKAVNDGIVSECKNDEFALVVKTLEGDVWARPGDYIVRGIKGELYPCKPDIFEDQNVYDGEE